MCSGLLIITYEPGATLPPFAFRSCRRPPRTIFSKSPILLPDAPCAYKEAVCNGLHREPAAMVAANGPQSHGKGEQVMPDIMDSFSITETDGVYVAPRPQSLQFRHRTVGGTNSGADNIEFPWYWTRLDHPALNDTPQAILTIIPVGRIEVDEPAHTAKLVQNPHPVGVVYRNHRWYIYNIGLESMTLRAEFNVAIHEARRPV